MKGRKGVAFVGHSIDIEGSVSLPGPFIIIFRCCPQYVYVYLYVSPLQHVCLYNQSKMEQQQFPPGNQIKRELLPVTTLQPTALSVQLAFSLVFDLQNQWMISECRVLMLELLAQYRPEQEWNIKEALVFGIGNFCSLRGDPENHQVSRYARVMRTQRGILMQLAIFLDIADNLRGDEDIKIDVFAQEILFSELEAAVLTQLDITILSDPEAQHRVKAGIFTFAPFWGSDLEMLCQCRRRQPTLHLGLTTEFLLGRQSLCIGGKSPKNHL